MLDEARRRGLPVPEPDGPDSSYRPFDRQVFWRRWWCGQGKCANAAVPGTSNHGEGIAVDCDPNDPARHRGTVDLIGAKYGWGSKGSDAPWERWHMKWQIGIWKQIVYRWLPLFIRNPRNQGGYVMILTGRLKNCGYLPSRTSRYTVQVRDAVRLFQQRHHLLVDGVVGPFTWEAVKAAEAACRRSGRKEI